MSFWLPRLGKSDCDCDCDWCCDCDCGGFGSCWSTGGDDAAIASLFFRPWKKENSCPDRRLDLIGPLLRLTVDRIRKTKNNIECIYWWKFGQIFTESRGSDYFLSTPHAYVNTLNHFCHLSEYLTIATVQDSGVPIPQGYHDKNSISMWTRGGRKLVDPSTYMSCMEVLKPDVFQLLADGDTEVKSSNKRIKKAVDATLSFAEMCTYMKENSQVLKDTPTFASVVGGYSVSERLRCINGLKEYDVDGYVIDGFHTNGDSATQMNWEEVEPVLSETLAALTSSKPSVFHGAVTPVTLLKLVSKGLDIFDATFPWMATERGGALTFPNSLLSSSSAKSVPTETLPTSSVDPAVPTNDTVTSDHPYEINLKDKRYFSDFLPLVADCSCYTCRKYSRAYIHHLMATCELLGPILLMMHNLHHYVCFFKNIRTAIREDQLDALEKTVRSCVA
nr:EOG090X08JG [Sida crystallina]